MYVQSLLSIMSRRMKEAWKPLSIWYTSQETLQNLKLIPRIVRGYLQNGQRISVDSLKSTCTFIRIVKGIRRIAMESSCCIQRIVFGSQTTMVPAPLCRGESRTKWQSGYMRLVEYSKGCCNHGIRGYGYLCREDLQNAHWIHAEFTQNLSDFVKCFVSCTVYMCKYFEVTCFCSNLCFSTDSWALYFSTSSMSFIFSPFSLVCCLYSIKWFP